MVYRRFQQRPRQRGNAFEKMKQQTLNAELVCKLNACATIFAINDSILLVLELR
ncbi:hypothetical protein F441_09984 [Phytophthora nicotianae CJ01A1]|uniref:Uncharacterized protein n=6 Tax=Phytophthora nicotianae TaxID=4792 RepID=W2R9D5_PHYN3|nr:hypothetical protein PPTG_21075 [Phytophthora nicotianae INRA-310]ETI57089.1 hypothetical protein F443_00559 [Phytophthora nicotianae P1569]ETK85314.1 hypothetical protein L915_09836 [Phytophthora nicotianae]ETO73949.1 hypothetical protein F444_10139 [Phytophthora nicotianae P1976]ETP15124.1 hypothetical protein F441_09984 [Phytophthora nicotianae CJ01A1]ETP43220.1 hypothetical protein F442_09950 [Phytophthora nicotianae P10297]